MSDTLLTRTIWRRILHYSDANSTGVSIRAKGMPCAS